MATAGLAKGDVQARYAVLGAADTSFLSCIVAGSFVADADLAVERGAGHALGAGIQALAFLAQRVAAWATLLKASASPRDNHFSHLPTPNHSFRSQLRRHTPAGHASPQCHIGQPFSTTGT
jgi:hypothetical protein